jgi:hypothetical protein
MDIELIVVCSRGKTSVVVDGSVALFETTLQKQIHQGLGIPVSDQKFPKLNTVLSAFENELENGSTIILEDDPTRAISGLIYIKLDINGYACRAIFDTGAEKITASYDYIKAIKCDHLIDTTYQGECKGVGKSKILGMIHDLKFLINNVSYTMPVLVTEMPDYIFLLSIEFMRKYQTVINCLNNEIIIGTNKIQMLTGDDTQDVKIPFKASIQQLYQEAKCLHSNPEEFNKLVSRILTNIKNNPYEPKFRTIKTQERTLKVLFDNPCSKKFIQEVGFFNNGESLNFQGNVQELHNLITC